MYAGGSRWVALAATLCSIACGTAAPTAPELPAAPPEKPAPAKNYIWASGRVLAMPSPQRAVLNRGAADGLVLGRSDLTVHPMLPSDDGKNVYVETNIRLARAKIVELRDRDCTLELSAIAEPVKVGAFVQFKWEVPPARSDDLLYEIGAYDIEFRWNDKDEPMFLWADATREPEATFKPRVLAVMLKEVKDLVELAGSVYTIRVEGGRFHGMSLGDAFAATQAQDIENFLNFVRAFPGKYLAHRWKFVEVYATWIINRTPSGERDIAVRKSNPLFDAGVDAAARGDFHAAELAWRQALALVPDSDKIKARLKSLERIRLDRDALDRDPDDTAKRWDLMVALFDRRAHGLVAQQLDKLERAGYKPLDCKLYRGMLLARQQKFAQAAQVLKQVAAAGDNSATLKLWLTYAEQMAASEANPASYAAKLALAKMHEGERSWDDALARYRDAMDVATTPAEMAEAHQGQRRIAVVREVEQLMEWAIDSAKKHNVANARQRAERVVAKLTQVGEVAKAAQNLAKLADELNGVWETEPAIEMRRWQLRLTPADADAWLNLGWLEQSVARGDAARQSVQKGLELNPKSRYGHLTLAQLAFDSGDLDEAQKQADMAAEDPNYAWAKQLQAQVAVTRGQWQRAADLADQAWQLLPDQFEMRQLRLGAKVMARAQTEIAANRDVERNRLRLIRALAWMDAPRAVTAATTQLPKTSKYWPAARAAVAQAAGKRFDAEERAQAARDMGAKTPSEKIAAEKSIAAAVFAAKPSPENRLRLANAFVAEGQYHRALATLGSVKPGTPQADAAELALRGLEADDVRDLAAQAKERSDYATAEKLYRQAYAMTVKVAPVQADYLLFMIAANLFSQGKHAEAKALIVEQLPRLRDQADPSVADDLAGLLAQIDSLQGNLSARREHAERTVAGCEAADNYYCLGNFEETLGRLVLAEGRLAEARGHFARAVQFADESGYAQLAMNALGGMADMHLTAGELPQCKKIAEPLLAKARKLGDVANEEYALMLLGAVALDSGDAKTAARYFGDVYELGVRAGDVWTRAMARLFQGRAVLNGLHDPAKAAPLLKQAAELYGAVGDGDGRARCLADFAEALAAQRQFAEARAVFAEVLALATKLDRKGLIARIYTALANMENDAGQPAVALPAAVSAVAIADGRELVGERWGPQHALAVALDKSGKLDDAFAAHDKAVQLLVQSLSGLGGEAERDGGLSVGRARDVFADAVEFCMRTGRVEKALEWLELSRDATLRRIFDPTKLKAQDGATKGTIDKIRQAEQQAAATKKALGEELAKPDAQRNQAVVDALGKVAAANDKELRQLMVQLNAKNPRMYQALSIKAEDIRELQRSLPEGAVVVEYFSADDALYAFVISRDVAKPKAYRVAVGATELERAVFDWRATVQARNPSVRGGKRAEVFGADAAAAPARNKELGQQLYKWLLGPLQGELAGATTVMVVPYGSLYYLPVHALETVDAAGKPQFALEKYRIGYLSAATRFRLGSNEARPPRSLLAFANPDGTLPGARAEVERVQRDSFPDAKVYFEKDATKEHFVEMAQKYRIIHFATHGILAADATASHLKMAAEPLTVFDISGLESLEGKTDLVVLSACETALQLGKSSGEELISIASAFATAGAPSLVASLWDVDDEATSELMAEFYRLLKIGKDGDGKPLDTLQALRQAQLHVMHFQRDGKPVFADPGYWAAFQLIGDFR